MNKNIIITILVVLVLGLGGYLVYDKVINVEEVPVNNNQQNNVQDTTNDVVIEQKDAAYFDQYLKAFLSCDGLSVSRNAENFSNKDITNFVSRYYNLLSEINAYDEVTYKVNVVDVDALIYKYFNKSNVVLDTNPNEITTITKQDNVYNFEWKAVGCGYYNYKDAVVTYNGENVTVKYAEYDGLGEKYTGKYLTFHLKYNNGNYNVIKIEG